MAFDDALADRVRDALAPRRAVEEKRMFGGLCFMVAGHMTVGIEKDRLMVRLAHAEAERLLGEPHVTRMEFTGRPMRGFLFVEAPALRTAPGVRKWVMRSLAHIETLPAKVAKPGKTPTPRKVATPKKGVAKKK